MGCVPTVFGMLGVLERYLNDAYLFATKAHTRSYHLGETTQRMNAEYLTIFSGDVTVFLFFKLDPLYFRQCIVCSTCYLPRELQVCSCSSISVTWFSVLPAFPQRL